MSAASIEDPGSPSSKVGRERDRLAQATIQLDWLCAQLLKRESLRGGYASRVAVGGSVLLPSVVQRCKGAVGGPWHHNRATGYAFSDHPAHPVETGVAEPHGAFSNRLVNLTPSGAVVVPEVIASFKPRDKCV